MRGADGKKKKASAASLHYRRTLLRHNLRLRERLKACFGFIDGRNDHGSRFCDSFEWRIALLTALLRAARIPARVGKIMARPPILDRVSYEAGRHEDEEKYCAMTASIRKIYS